MDQLLSSVLSKLFSGDSADALVNTSVPLSTPVQYPITPETFTSAADVTADGTKTLVVVTSPKDALSSVDSKTNVPCRVLISYKRGEEELGVNGVKSYVDVII